VDQTRLAEVEGRLAEYRDRQKSLKVEGVEICSHGVNYVADVGELFSALRDALDLLGRVACDERHAVEVGAAWERGAVVELLQAVRDRLDAADDVTTLERNGVLATLSVVDKNLRARGPCLPALPAETLATQNERLRGALGELVTWAESWLAALRGTEPPVKVRLLDAILARARAALREGD
jgi:hypothetical protein